MTSVICAAPPPPTSAPAHSRATRSGAAAPPAPHGRTLARGTILPVEMDRRSKMTEYRHFIGGQWTPASGGATYEDRNPYTGEVLAKVAAGTREDARRAEEVVGLLAAETGCCIYGFGMFQMGFVPGLLRQAAALAYSPIGQVLPSD